MLNSFILSATNLFQQSWPKLKPDLSFLNFGIDFHSKAFEFLIYLALIIILAFIIDRLLLNSFLGSNYRVFVAPGIILHELSHALLCFLTGAKIKSISFFDKEGGSVKHEQPKIPVLGQMLISLAPFVFGVAAIYLLAHYLGIKSETINLSEPKYSDFSNHIGNLIRSIKISSYQNWVLVYLALSVAVTMTPSKQDFLNITIPLILMFFAIGAGIYFHFDFSKLNLLPVDKVLVILSPILLLLILALLFSIIIYVLTKIVKR